jgi:protein-S-isoprenylcysteine O-methyltransferase Ste14
MTANSDRGRRPEATDPRRLVLGIVWTLLVMVLCLFLPAGTWAWARGWGFLVVFVVASIVITFYLRRVNPDIVAARVNRHEGTKSWDRWLLCILFPAIIAILPTAALDDGRYHWLPMPWWVCGIGYALLLLGLAGVTWAEAVNKFFEPTVRIQHDRDHTVVDAGPYALVRHPGYVTGCLIFLGLPLCLGSFWALIPALLACLILLVRTILEDATLRSELRGYEEYAQRVRFRWVPGVW